MQHRARGLRHAGGNVTAHKIRRKTARGSKMSTKGTRAATTPGMVRITGSFPVGDWACLEHVARVKKLPIAQVLRDAVWAYALPFRKSVQ